MKQSAKERIIGKAIHHFRIRYGWTFREFAEEYGIKPSEIAMVENGYFKLDYDMAKKDVEEEYKKAPFKCRLVSPTE